MKKTGKIKFRAASAVTALLVLASYVAPSPAFAVESPVVPGLTCEHGLAFSPYPDPNPIGDMSDVAVPNQGPRIEGIPYKNTMGHPIGIRFPDDTPYKIVTMVTTGGGETSVTYSPAAGRLLQKGYDVLDCTEDRFYYLLGSTGCCQLAYEISTPAKYEKHEISETPDVLTNDPNVYIVVNEDGSREMRKFTAYDKLIDGTPLENRPYIKSGTNCRNRGGYYKGYKCQREDCEVTVWEYVENEPVKHVDNNSDGVCDKCDLLAVKAAKPSAPRAQEVTTTKITLKNQTSPQGEVRFSFDGEEYSTKNSWTVEPGTTHTIKAKVFTPDSSELIDSDESSELKVTSKSLPVSRPTTTPRPTITPRPTRAVSTSSLASALRKTSAVPTTVKPAATATPTPKASSQRKLHSKTTYKVVRGDTLASIANAFGMSEAKLRTKNGFSSSYKPSVGEKITIWNGTEVDNGEPEKIEQSPLRSDPRLGGYTDTAGKKYKVAPGDSLIDIADAAGVELSKFAKGNSLSSSMTGFRTATVLRVK